MMKKVRRHIKKFLKKILKKMKQSWNYFISNNLILIY